MKILQIIFSLSSGGGERFVVDLSNELSKTNDVTLLTLKDDTIDVENRNFYKFDLLPKVTYMNLGFADGFHTSYPWKTYKVIKRLNPDIVHIHLGGVLNYCYLACLLLGRKITFVQTIHSDLYNGYTNKFYRFVYRTLLIPRKLSWAALSDINFQQVKKEYPKAVCRCIYNGRAPMRPTIRFDDARKEIDSYKDNDETKVVLHVARCHPVKNQQLLIRCFNVIRQCGYNAVLLIIGADYDSELGNKLKKLIGGGTYFLGTRKDIADYMLQADVFVLSSLSEGMPITLIEAMLSGVPMVSTPVTGAKDVINGKNGVLSKDFDPESFTEALREVLDNNDKYKDYSLKHKNDSPYTIGHCAEQYMDFYRAVHV